MAFKNITIFQVPPQIKMLAEQHGKREGAAVYIVGETVYIIAGRGKKPTKGYGIEIMDVVETKKGCNIDVYVDYQNPKPGQVFAQVINYPIAVAKYNPEELSEEINFRFIINGIQKARYAAQRLEQ